MQGTPIRVRAIVRRRSIILPKWVRELLGWGRDELLLFRLEGESIVVERGDGYSRRMQKGWLRIPRPIAKKLDIDDAVVWVRVEGCKLVICTSKPASP